MIAMLSWNGPTYWFKNDLNQFAVLIISFAA